jgi:hypothetical protein
LFDDKTYYKFTATRCTHRLIWYPLPRFELMMAAPLSTFLQYDGDGKLAKALDARPLTNAVKDLEAKMKAEHSSRRAVLH